MADSRPPRLGNGLKSFAASLRLNVPLRGHVPACGLVVSAKADTGRNARSEGLQSVALAWPRFYLLLLLLLLPGLALAQQPPPPAPPSRVFVILCDALTLDDLRDSRYPHLAHFAETGALGLMNCAVAGAKTPTAATLTLAAGQQVPAEATDEQAAGDWESVAGERGSAREVYARRTGEPAASGVGDNPNRAVRHLGIAALARRGLDTARLGAAPAQASPPVSTFVCGNADTNVPNRRAALLTVDAKGTGEGVVGRARQEPESPFGLADDPILLSQTAVECGAQFVVIQLGDTARAEAIRPQLSEAAYRAARAEALRRLNVFFYLLTAQLAQEGEAADILLVSPYPPAEDARRPNAWNRLTPLIATGPHFSPGLLTSATTRTPGLVANIDLAPTILSLFHAPVPPAMVGRPIRSISDSRSGPERSAFLARMDYVATLNGQALTRVVPWLALIGLPVVGIGLAARRRRGAAGSRPFAPIFTWGMTLPAALMLAPLLVPPTLIEYGLRILAWMVGLTAACLLAGRFLKTTPVLVAALLNIALVAGDTLAGQPLLKESLLSSYPLSGIRYYGVGNEYLGVVLGCALTGEFAWLDERRVPYPPERAGITLRRLLILLWLGLLLLLGWPGLGANAGSLIATATGFGIGAAILRGKRPTWRFAVGCALCGLLLSFAFGALDAALAGSAGSSSHAGAAIQAAAGGRGLHYLGEIASRKLQMNLRLLVAPWFVLTAVLIAATLATVRAFAGDALRQVLARRPWLRHGLSAALASALAALLFKDSGVVTVAFLVATSSVIVFHYLFADKAGNGGPPVQ